MAYIKTARPSAQNRTKTPRTSSSKSGRFGIGKFGSAIFGSSDGYTKTVRRTANTTKLARPVL